MSTLMCYPKTSIRFRDHENATKLRTSILAFKLLFFTVNTKPGKTLIWRHIFAPGCAMSCPLCLTVDLHFEKSPSLRFFIQKKTDFFIPLTRFWLRALTHVNFNHVNKIARGKIKSAELKRESERGSTFTLTSDISCIASILFANVNFTHVRTLKLRDTGNQPLVQTKGQNAIDVSKQICTSGKRHRLFIE